MSLPEPEFHHLDVVRTARYATIGAIDESVSDLWFALHGYGQLAAEFAQPFRRHRRPDRLIVIPEGLSRFYRNNRERIVGASWMTAEDRKMEIRDYIRYLNGLFRHLVENGVDKNVRITVLAFSQGAATATRWLADGAISVDRLILWGGIPAFELCTDEFQIRVPVPRIQLVTGTEDRYLTPARHAEIQSTLSRNGNDVECLVFTGSHAIDDGMLAKLFGDDEPTSAAD